MATDSFGRRIDYLRISLTDRCNLRCVYCMPAGGVEWRPHHEMLTLEQIELFAAIAVEEGVSKIRLTGGEPLVRKGVLGHVARLKAMTGIEGIALTTNGILLPKYAEELVAAGLSRVNVSIDSLDPEVYRRVTRGGDLAQALAGLDAAQRAGMRPLKLNTVVMRGLAADPFDFARLSLERPLHVRFIEFMPVGNQASREAEPDAWMKGQVVPAAEILERVSEAGVRAGVGELQPLTRDEAPGGWGPAM